MSRAKDRVLFLCTGNSARSQMAEGLLREMAGDRYEALSAGMEPQPEVHPLAVRAMAEIGIDISEQQPKPVREYLGLERIRWLIIVCDRAKQTCPRVWPLLAEDARLYWPFDDPAAAAGSGEERLAVFRRVRDEIRERLEAWLREGAAD
jgi:arsenate reductase